MALKPIVPVILSGGSGQRLWPISREFYPKQLINLVSDDSMLQETAKRLGGPIFGPPLVVCNDEHRFIVAEQLRDAGIETQAIVLEPQQRNTAPAAALAALILERRDPETVMLLAPSDHVIANQEAFLSAVRTGAEAARAGRLVTFGITPDHSATSYGYIKKGKAIDGIEGCFAIELFTEKPNAETAAGFLYAEYSFCT
ncbi:MAG: NTP transferase domain-containing protein, partial [Proteobacteria bacterium]|nr:NTP transferase domain-containing protein [Pseudomonadota bacterium]